LFLLSFAGGEDKVEVRKYLCVCEYCLKEKWEQCLNVDYVGAFEQKMQEKLDIRQPKSRYMLGKGENNILFAFVPKKILKSRSYAKGY
jgi:hypothetical protein